MNYSDISEIAAGILRGEVYHGACGCGCAWTVGPYRTAVEGDLGPATIRHGACTCEAEPRRHDTTLHADAYDAAVHFTAHVVEHTLTRI